MGYSKQIKSPHDRKEIPYIIEEAMEKEVSKQQQRIRQKYGKLYEENYTRFDTNATQRFEMKDRSDLV